MPANKSRVEDLLDELARGARVLRVFSQLGSESFPVSNAAHHVLRIVLRQQPIHAAAVAHYLGIGPGVMSRHIAELESAALVQRVNCSTDARRQLLTVTETGEALIQERDRIRGERLTRLLPDWSGERLDEAISILHELNDAMGRGVEEAKSSAEVATGGDAK